MGSLKLLLGLTGGITFLFFLSFPTPSEMAGFYVGCTAGNFNPTDMCLRICRMLGNMTSCCYGVNHAGRTACGCCQNVTSCPYNCEGSCAMVSIVTSNCGGGNVMGDLPKRHGNDGAEVPSEFDQCLASNTDLIPVEKTVSPVEKTVSPVEKIVSQVEKTVSPEEPKRRKVHKSSLLKIEPAYLRI